MIKASYTRLANRMDGHDALRHIFKQISEVDALGPERTLQAFLEADETSSSLIDYFTEVHPLAPALRKTYSSSYIFICSYVVII